MLYALLSLVSCTKEIQRVEEERVPIAISVDNIQTKASIFDTPASINNPKVGGGDFALYAFVSGNSSSTGNMYMDHARVNYFPDARRWRFADADGIYFNYFWPLGEHLDFFGHFPLNAEDAGVTEVTYTYEDGPSFEYSLPLHSYDESAARNASLVASDTRNQEGLYEFMYSFVQDQSVETQNADPSDPGVKMHFSHPFAAVSFHLDHAYRMTLHEIVLSEIKYKGNYMTTGFERKIPLLPWTIVIYFGCYVFWAVNYFLCAAQDTRERNRFFLADLFAKGVCFVLFLVLPTTNVRPEIGGNGVFDQMMRFLY